MLLIKGNEVPRQGDFTTLSAPKDYIPLHVRGGYIIPTQHPQGKLNLRDWLAHHNIFPLNTCF